MSAQVTNGKKNEYNKALQKVGGMWLRCRRGSAPYGPRHPGALRGPSEGSPRALRAVGSPSVVIWSDII
jgi:hypothetical protein